MTRTFVDAGVLIAAASGRERPDVQHAAIAVLDDAGRQFVSSVFLQLEVLPKAIHERKSDEADFYEAFFADVSAWAYPLDRVADIAQVEARRYGLAAMDALHVAAAMLLGAEEFVTTERSQKPIHRVTGIKVVSIHPSALHLS